MNRIAFVAAFILLFSIAASAQDDPEQNVSVRAGGAFPEGKLLRSIPKRPLVGLSYGYRWNRHWQFDLGFDTVFSVFSANGLDSRLGDVKVHDYLFLVPVGVRWIAPLKDDRFQAFAGAGGLYLRYQFSPSDRVSGSCGLCVSRNAGGYYVLAGGNAALDGNRRFRAGGSLRYNTGYGSQGGYRTIDRWWSVTGDFTYTFK